MSRTYFLGFLLLPYGDFLVKNHQMVGTKIPKNMFVPITSMFWYVDDEEPAVLRLVDYFRGAIQNIIRENYPELPPRAEVVRYLKSQRKKNYFFNFDDHKALLRVPDNVTPKWSGVRTTEEKLKDLKNKVCGIIYSNFSSRCFEASVRFGSEQRNSQDSSLKLSVQTVLGDSR